MTQANLENLQDYLAEIVSKVTSNFKIFEMILFGSFAWGNPSENSDLDLLIVGEFDELPSRRAAKVGKVLTPRKFPIDIIVLTQEELNEKLSGGWPFYEKILSQGKVLYRAQSA
jgi:predicted nucleotidyltransferase